MKFIWMVKKMNNSQESIAQLLRELLETHSMSAQSLAERTGVPVRFIESLVRGDFDQLPARPYIRGYLFKIADVFKIDPGILWGAYRKGVDIATSGADDRFPSNRFAIAKISPHKIVLILFVILLAVFIGFRFNDILGKPTISVDIPKLTDQEIITVRGNVSPGDRLILNNEVIYPRDDGKFEKNVQLEPGLNTLKFNINRHLGREATEIHQVFYQPTEIIQELPQ